MDNHNTPDTKTNPEKASTLRTYGTVLIILACLLLAGGSLRTRAVQIARSDAPYWTLPFIQFMIAMVLLALTVTWLTLSGKLVRFVQHSSIAAVISVIVVSFAGGLLMPQLRIVPPVYSDTVLIWSVGFNAGLLVWIIDRYQGRLRIDDILHTLALVALGIIIPLFFLEVGLRAYFSLFGTQAQKISYIYSVDEALRINNRYIGLPYINYGLSPQYSDHNRQGFRGTPLQIPKPDNIFRIFALGGSTTYGSSLQSADAWPAQLQHILQTEYGYTNIEVVNAGVEAYSSFDSLANLIYKVLDYEPDMVIIYHGVNDVNARLVDPAAYSGLNEQRGTWQIDRVERAVSPFTLVRFVRIAMTGGPNLNNVQIALFNSRNVEICTLSNSCSNLGMTPQEVLAANPPIYFERNLRNIAAIARASDVDVMFSTWTYFPEEIPDTSGVMARDYYQQAVDQQNELVLQLGAQLAVPVYDLAAAMPYNRDFWIDTMHMTAIGTNQQAELYAAFLVENNLIPSLED